MNIIDYIPFGQDRAVTYPTLQNLTGLCKREVREAISRARKDIMILNMQDGKGFFRPIEGKEDNLIVRFLRQEESRNKEHNQTLAPIRKYFYMKGIE